MSYSVSIATVLVTTGVSKILGKQPIFLPCFFITCVNILQMQKQITVRQVDWD